MHYLVKRQAMCLSSTALFVLLSNTTSCQPSLAFQNNNNSTTLITNVSQCDCFWPCVACDSKSVAVEESVEVAIVFTVGETKRVQREGPKRTNSEISLG